MRVNSPLSPDLYSELRHQRKRHAKRIELCGYSFAVTIVHTLGASELLDLWDAGQDASPMRRTILLLRAVFPEESEVEQWPLGLLNRRLLTLRARLFGAELVSLADCQACGAVGEISIPLPSMSSGADIDSPWPMPDDLSRFDRAVRPAETSLLARVVERTWRDGAVLTTDHIPGVVRTALERRIEEIDPLAQVELVFTCPACQHGWRENFHIIDVLWMEISALAKRLQAPCP